MTVRTLFFSLLTVVLLATAVGCDSNSNDPSEADQFLGTWNAVGVADGTGDQTASFAQSVSQFQVTFASATTYNLNVVFTDQRPPIQFNGASYSVNEATNVVTLVIPAAVTGSVELNLPFTYVFSNSNNTVALSNTSLLPVINQLFGTTYTGSVTVTVQRQ